MKPVILLIKGMIVGVVHIVPGLSSGTFMVLLRVYDELVESVGGLVSSLKHLDDLKKRLFFLVPLALGVAIGTVAIAKVASVVLDAYPVLSVLFFIGVIAGGIPAVVKMHPDMKPKVGRVIAFLIGAAIAIAVGLVGKSESLAHTSTDASVAAPNLLQLAVGGFFAGSAMMTPGLSGSYILLLTGTYEPIIEALDSLTRPPVQLMVLIPATLGLVLGILIFAKLTSLLMKRWPSVTFYAILGLICGSLIGLWPAGFAFTEHTLVGFPLLIVGAVIAYYLGALTEGEAAAFEDVAEAAEIEETLGKEV
jgi:putative membrane protein